ncbi:hypothetical protein NL108_012648 [Boleophthalmus pectinirostris]|uniref:uncharacterized protein si:dkeyp-110g5.4 n=1 Tax=Boleophthalmus pectinirostris TaxID=150288 RepID=UPI002432D3D7|nr:uncharacterized protein si:dkeyp-110g5.4 [Boleophthalmus pectinirostris]XP_020779607.2 uncharacterized protein si:dkeyp-110g5.4 [Boleophthalmus pectinirostris]KAJ0064717.1 hypothetical protein NL108_012648 [Boleophthalmus pectinirostris]
MELLQGLEVYIPPEAEVKRVPLLSLSTSVRRKMGLSAGLDSLPDSPLCVWISPALFQRKGQKDLPQSRGAVRQQVLSVLNNSQACPSLSKGYGQCKMTFVTAHSTAYKVLKETLPMDSNTQLCSSPRVPQGVLSETELDAVIIHQGRVYLSVKKAKKQAAKPHSIATGQVEPVIHTTLKRKRNSPSEGTNKSRSNPSAGQQGVAQSQGSSAGTSHSLSASVGAPQSHTVSVGAPQSHTVSVGAPQSHTVSVGAPQSHTVSVGAPQSHTVSVGAPQSHTVSVGPLRATVSVWGPLRATVSVWGLVIARGTPGTRSHQRNPLMRTLVWPFTVASTTTLTAMTPHWPIITSWTPLSRTLTMRSWRAERGSH